MRLVDWQIDQLVKETGMIEPYIDHQVSHRVVDDAAENEAMLAQGYDFGPQTKTEKVISYGLTSAGYDIRVADEFKIFAPVPGAGGAAVDPKNFDNRLLRDFKGSVCEIPPHSYVLCRSVEKFNIPKDVVVTCLGKSTYARCGLHVNVTPLEPGWRGILTIEISNAGPAPVKIYANEGIAQLLFDVLKAPARVSYADRGGKYQDQVGIVPPRMKEAG